MKELKFVDPPAVAPGTPEPDYLAQCSAEDIDERYGGIPHNWQRERTREAEARGCTHGRYSYDEKHRLYLIEGWIVRPENEGEPRWQLTAA